MNQKRTKWRLDGHAWVISKIKECSDLDEMLETMPMKYERKRTWGKHRTRNNKHYVQNECDFLTIRIRIRKRRKRRILMGQNVNENKAMTKVVIAKRRTVKVRRLFFFFFTPPPFLRRQHTSVISHTRSILSGSPCHVANLARKMAKSRHRKFVQIKSDAPADEIHWEVSPFHSRWTKKIAKIFRKLIWFIYKTSRQVPVMTIQCLENTYNRRSILFSWKCNLGLVFRLFPLSPWSLTI